MSNTFGKEYKLVGKATLEAVYRNGKTIKEYPFVIKCLYITNSNQALQVAISVPKRNHKSAVSRNLIKRRIREALRLNKSLLINELNSHQKQLAIFVIYTTPEIQEFSFLERKIKKVYQKLQSTINDSTYE